MQRFMNWESWRISAAEQHHRRPHKTRAAPRRRGLSFEALENRSLLSATVTSLGTTGGSVTSGNLSFGAAAAVAAGESVIVEIAANPDATPTVSDARGNAYTLDAHAANVGNVENWIFSAPVTTALIAGDAITVHFEATSPVAEVVSTLAVSGLAPSARVDRAQVASGTGTAADSGLTAATSQASELLIGAIGVAGPSGDAFTPGSGYTLVGRAGVTSGTDVTINPEFRSVGAAGQYNAAAALGTSRPWAAAIATYAEQTPNQQFISQVYLDFLNRPADPTGLADWSALLDAGQSRQQVVYEIEQTQEYANVTVQQLYQRYLHRAADPTGLSDFSSQLLAGRTIEQVSASIAGSEEFFVTQGGSTNDGFLNALYQDALGRPIDSFGLHFWELGLDLGLTRNQVSFLVMSSQEYRHDVVVQAYQHLLGRTPSTFEAVNWQTVLNFGGTDQQVYSGIAGSQEYFEKAQA